MFGLAVWNDATRTLVLARDRLGIKPLYYAVLPDGLVFASELKADVRASRRLARAGSRGALRVSRPRVGPAPRSMVRACASWRRATG